jgi:DNA adenine methylase
LVGCRGQVVLSGYASELYDSMLAGWRRVVIRMAHNADQRRTKATRDEVLWIKAAEGAERSPA